eukprot:1141006-Pelagomonas_calceolata.AAC.5
MESRCLMSHAHLQREIQQHLHLTSPAGAPVQAARVAGAEDRAVSTTHGVPGCMIACTPTARDLLLTGIVIRMLLRQQQLRDWGCSLPVGM